jgi:hypothetical protein
MNLTDPAQFDLVANDWVPTAVAAPDGEPPASTFPSAGEGAQIKPRLIKGLTMRLRQLAEQSVSYVRQSHRLTLYSLGHDL